ncbi:hypothetical protein IWQ60_003698 [Tieghemiomyces parasiticus]|uniref:Uncharacterized protein n=1 Tax=Tieghemiomyces parasiticus TaxID=78921 RepID=A0A9W8AAB0_9FUNG|nr:hypothetical protein IWQ60_003698 [Tieghemiomyces parasiticus]
MKYATSAALVALLATTAIVSAQTAVTAGADLQSALAAPTLVDPISVTAPSTAPAVALDAARTDADSPVTKLTTNGLSNIKPEDLQRLQEILAKAQENPSDDTSPTTSAASATTASANIASPTTSSGNRATKGDDACSTETGTTGRSCIENAPGSGCTKLLNQANCADNCPSGTQMFAFIEGRRSDIASCKSETDDKSSSVSISTKSSTASKTSSTRPSNTSSSSSSDDDSAAGILTPGFSIALAAAPMLAYILQ